MIYTTGTSRPPTGGQGTRKCQSKAAIRQQRSAQIHLPNRSEGQAHFACHFHAGHKMCSPWVHLNCVNPSQSALTRCAFSTTKIRWPVFDNAIAAVSDQLHHLNKRLQHDTGTSHPETASQVHSSKCTGRQGHGSSFTLVQTDGIQTEQERVSSYRTWSTKCGWIGCGFVSLAP